MGTNEGNSLSLVRDGPFRRQRESLLPSFFMFLRSSSIKAATLTDLLHHELKDLYDAEQRLTEALPEMAEAASNSQLKKAFQNHLKETKEHCERLEEVFDALGWKSERQKCDGMKGLLEEGEHVLKSKLRGSVKDAALISAAQRMEHYEMAAYGSARTYADVLGHQKVSSLLQETLDEEGRADKLLTKIAESVNEKAPAGSAA